MGWVVTCLRVHDKALSKEHPRGGFFWEEKVGGLRDLNSITQGVRAELIYVFLGGRGSIKPGDGWDMPKHDLVPKTEALDVD